MIMKKNVVLLMSLLVVGLVVSSCHYKFEKTVSVKTGLALVEDSVDEYERVVVEAACDVKFIQSDVSMVKIKCDKSDLGQIRHYVSDGVLYIVADKRKGGSLLQVRDMGDVDIELYSPDLIGLELKGAGEVEIDELDTDTLTIEMRGAGDVDLGNIVCDRLDTRLHGAGSIKIESLTTQWADIELKGVGNVDVGFVNSGNVKCSLKGVGNVKLRGNVRKLTKSVKGTGNVDVSELRIKEK